MWDVFKEMLTSKKFIASVAGVIVAATARIGLELPVEDVAAILAPIIAYIVGQGWADTGKEAVKEEKK